MPDRRFKAGGTADYDDIRPEVQFLYFGIFYFIKKSYQIRPALRKGGPLWNI